MNNDKTTILDDRLGEKIGQAASQKSMFGLLAIAILLVAGLLGLHILTDEYESSISLVNISGRQRMLSVRAQALEEEMINNHGQKARKRLKIEIMAVASQLEKAHIELTEGLVSSGLFHKTDETMELFYEEPAQLDKRMKEFITNIRLYANGPVESWNQDNPLHTKIHEEMDNGRLLIALDMVVQSYQRASEQSIAQMRTYTEIVFLLIVGALFLEVEWILRPMFKRMEDEKEKLNQAVEQRTSQLANAYKEAEEEIAARKKVEAELLESEQRLHVVVGALPVIISVIDQNGEYVMSEGKGLKALGLQPGQRVGQLISDYYGGEDNIPEVYRNAMTGIAGNAMESMDGRIFYTRAEPIKGRDGQVKAVISVAIDITEKVQAEKDAQIAQKRLIHADKMRSLGSLVAGVAHEINNPNSFVMMNASIFEKIWLNVIEQAEQNLGPEEYLVPGELTMGKAKEFGPKLLEGIRNGSCRIRDIVERLKNFARKDYESPKKAIDLNETVIAALKFTANIVNSSTRRFATNLSEGLPNVYANSTEIEQVIVNLVTNACQALTSRSQSITVSTFYDASSNTCRVSVVDEGCGMPQDLLDHAIEPFITTKRQSGGMGLGLSVSYSIIHDTGGRLEFESSVSEYTKATVLLPALGAARLDQAMKSFTDQ